MERARSGCPWFKPVFELQVSTFRRDAVRRTGEVCCATSEHILGFRQHAILLDVRKILTDRNTVQQSVSSAFPQQIAIIPGMCESHLAPKGRLVIDVFVPNLKILLQVPDETQVISKFDSPSGKGTVRVLGCSHYETDTQILYTVTSRE